MAPVKADLLVLGCGDAEECVDCGGLFRPDKLVFCEDCESGWRCPDCHQAHEGKVPA